MQSIRDRLQSLANPKKATDLGRFFKTGKGDYGEGDLFLGIMVPIQRRVVAEYWRTLSIPQTIDLLASKWHEHRLVALLILVKKYQKGTPEEKDLIFRSYLSHAARINNWDLVDLSARDIVGEHLLARNRALLYTLAQSSLLWERRIAVISTFAFMRNHDTDDTYALARLLLTDKHDLMHKAVGWALREAGKRDEAKLAAFLDTYATRMPRTMLRYAIEKFTEDKRKHYLALK